MTTPTDSTLAHLRAVEHQPFYPLGWLYQRVFADLQARGLIRELPFGGFAISEQGRRLLLDHPDPTHATPRESEP